MIEGLRPYPGMASPGADWLPTLPHHWELHRAKANFREVDERSLTGDEELLSVSHKTGVTPRSQKNITMFMAESYEGHKTCKPGDIVVNTLWAWMAALGASGHVGIISPAYGVYRQRAEAFDPRYLDYLLRTETYRGEYLRSSRGITTSRLRLYPPDFLDIPFVQPPLDEQRLIVRFLDWHGAMTGKLIRAKRRLISLLNEQKQSIIHRAVTRGLDPAAKLKPSGVDWLGDVPEHWTVKPLKHIVNRIVGGSTPKSGEPEYWDGDVIWVTPSDISRNDRLDTSLRKITDGGLASCGASLVPAGSVIVTTRAPVGNVAVAQVALATNQGCKALIPNPKHVGTGFAFHLLKILKPELVSHATGTTFAEISSSKLGAVRVPVPPIHEQSDILGYVNESTIELNDAIMAAEAEIAFIQEFRTRLIADVVTGQLDVRAMAASLPDVAEADAAGDLTDEDDLDNDADALIDEEEAA